VTEADFCDQIRAWAEAAGLEVYPEVSGWDLVLVARMDCQPGRLDLRMGEQVGIHAKLRANCEVLAQCLPPAWERSAYPDYAVAAAPKVGRGFRDVARHLGIGVLVGCYGGAIGFREQPRRVAGYPQLKLPAVASRAIRAGVPSPRVLSPWRERALSFLRWARANDGRISLNDLRAFELSLTRARLWLVDTGDRTPPAAGQRPRFLYRLTAEAHRLPDHGYEDVYAELCAALDRDEGPPVASPARPRQLAIGSGSGSAA
jgi:hypothetical protein